MVEPLEAKAAAEALEKAPGWFKRVAFPEITELRRRVEDVDRKVQALRESTDTQLRALRDVVDAHARATDRSLEAFRHELQMISALNHEILSRIRRDVPVYQSNSLPPPPPPAEPRTPVRMGPDEELP